MARGKVLARWHRIISMVQGGRSLTAGDLAKRCGVHERTIFRDMRSMEQVGVPVFYDGETYRLADNWDVPAVQFTPAEVLALIAMLEKVRTGRGGDARVAGSALRKLATALNGGKAS